MRVLFLAWFAAGALWAAAPESDHLRCKHKIETIVTGKAAPGSQVSFTASELNAFLNTEVLQIIPGAVQGARLELGQGTASGSASVNFIKLLQAKGKSPGWLLIKMLDGWKLLKGSARIQSDNGRATVNIVHAELSGMTVPAFLVEFMVTHFALPYSPDLKIGQPFALKHGIERLEVQPGRFAVVMRRAASFPIRTQSGTPMP